MDTQQWEPYDQGSILGGKGSENGTALFDEVILPVCSGQIDKRVFGLQILLV